MRCPSYIASLLSFVSESLSQTVPTRRLHTVRDLYRAQPIPSLRNTRPSRNHLRTLEHHTPFHYEDVGTLLPTEAAPTWSSA